VGILEMGMRDKVEMRNGPQEGVEVEVDGNEGNG
jgi:hypothetical protein